MKSLTLDRLLQSQGFGSRKECRTLVKKGVFSVGGVVLTDPDKAMDPIGLSFEWEGEVHLFREKVYLALNKPLGYECSVAPRFHTSVFDLFPRYQVQRGIQSAGRLDQDTTGLLLFSDDGEFLHKITSPKNQVPKTYQAGTRYPVSPDQVSLLLSGVQLRGEQGPDRALDARILGECELEMTIDQGKYHQVRRMIAASGNFCTVLHRTRVGNLDLKSLNLTPGEWSYLKPERILSLTSNGDIST